MEGTLPQRVFCKYLSEINDFALAQAVGAALEQFGSRSLMDFKNMNRDSYHFAIKTALKVFDEDDDLDLFDAAF